MQVWASWFWQNGRNPEVKASSVGADQYRGTVGCTSPICRRNPYKGRLRALSGAISTPPGLHQRQARAHSGFWKSAAEGLNDQHPLCSLVESRLIGLPSEDGLAGEERRAAGETSPVYWLLLAESHLTRQLFGSMVRRIAALPLPTG
jgi:hypothetical protein